MSQTWHEESVEVAAVEALRDSPVMRDLIFEVLDNMKGGRYNSIFVDSIVQKHQGGYNLYDAYCVAQFLCEMHAAELVITLIDMGREPYPDRMVEENDAILGRLPAPYRGEFFGGKDDRDGSIWWDTPIVAKASGLDCEVPRGGVPLEVGTTKASRSLMHLRFEGGLARWPYGHRYCNLFVYRDPLKLSRDFEAVWVSRKLEAMRSKAGKPSRPARHAPLQKMLDELKGPAP